MSRWKTMLAAGALLLPATLTGPLTFPAQALDNGVARTPPMGWNTWNTFGCNINETLIRQTADSLVTSGLKDVGYEYLTVDDCWFNPNRDASGNLQSDPVRFPSGMKDARQFAAWGVDYLKYDWCSPSGTISDQITTFAKMRDALGATGRPIVYSINPNSFHASTGPQRNWGDVANLWRTTEDITLSWDTGNISAYPMGVQNIVNINVPLAGYAGPGQFNDPDMLEVGRGTLTETEQRSHFALWAIMASPLIAGNDVRSMTAATQAILKNAELIAINQDPLALQARQVSHDGTRRVLAKTLENGDVAVALFNQGNATTTVSTTTAAIGKAGTSFTVRDAWTGATSTSTGAISAAVPAHGTAVFRVSGGTTTPPVTSPPAATSTLVNAASGRCLDVPESATVMARCRYHLPALTP
jgi:alpha-galactosidase